MASVLAKRKRTAADAWIEALDPLNGLSIAQARNVYNAARRHGSPLLQKMFAEIEESDPVLMTCVERRQSALAGLGWRTVANASARDEALAEEQRVALEEFANGIVDLDDAVEHLGLGFFRGYSVCQPIWEGNAVRHVALLDSWNFLRGEGGGLLWNPECSMDPAKCEEITPEARAVVFRRRRAIDWPALNIYIRKYIGERDWGRFLERYGIPPVDVVMAPNTTNEQRSDYLESAEAARDGRPAAWPAGSQISRAEGSRGQDPFSAFLEHQEKLVVLMATGGTLTSLAQADTGSLAGGAQMDVWTQIVARDGVAVSAAMNRDLFGPFLRAAFPGRPVLARFELGREDEPTAAEAADMAVKLRGAGYRVDQAQLEEATGYKLEREESAQPAGGFGGLALNKAPAAPKAPAPEEDAKVAKLAAAFRRDMRPVGEELRKLLATPEGGLKAACNELARRLPKMIPAKPEMAEALEAAVRDGEDLATKNAKDAEGEEAIANAQARGKTSPESTPGSFAPEGGGGGGKKGAETKAEKAERQKANAARGAANMSRLESGEDCPDFMESKKLGTIAFYQGNDHEGYLHIKNNPDPDHQAMLADNNIPDTLAYGKYYPDGGGWMVVNGEKCVVLGKDGNRGVKIVTAYLSKGKATAFTRRGGQIENRCAGGAE